MFDVVASLAKLMAWAPIPDSGWYADALAAADMIWDQAHHPHRLVIEYS